MVVVGFEPDLVDVERLGAIDVSHRHGHEFELEIHTSPLSWYARGSGGVRIPLAGARRERAARRLAESRRPCGLRFGFRPPGALREAEVGIRTLTGFDRTTAEAAIEAMRQAVAEMKKPRFALNPQSDAADARLIVLDEVSMVGEEMARDLMSFGKPILVLGDPGQLPPIKGEGAFTKDAPDIMLTEIHRQAAESAIIRLATMARHGQPIGFGQHDTFVWKMRKADVTPEQCLRGGQVICGMNATRLQLNNGMRRAAGFGGRLPPHRHGREDHLPEEPERLGLINGMFLTLEDIVDEGSLFFSATVTDEDGHPIGPPAQRRGPAAHLQGALRGPRRLRQEPPRPRLAGEAQADRGDLRLGDHHAQGAGLAVGERHRLGRRARREATSTGGGGSTPRSPAPSTASSFSREVRASRHDRPQRRLVAAAPHRPRRGEGAARRDRRRLAAGPLSAGTASRPTGGRCVAPTSRAGRRGRRAPASCISTGPTPAGASTSRPASGPARST